jgi:hypothetical protein
VGSSASSIGASGVNELGVVYCVKGFAAMFGCEGGLDCGGIGRALCGGALCGGGGRSTGGGGKCGS